MRPITVVDRIVAQIPSMRRYARALLRDADAADRLVADVLVKATAAPRFGRGMTIRAALFAMLYEAMLGQCGGPLDGTAETAQTEQPQPEPRWPAGTATDDVRAVKRALAQLPAEDRALLLLACLEDFSPAEVAAITGLSPETVSARLAWSRSRVAQVFERTRMAALIGVLLCASLPLAA